MDHLQVVASSTFLLMSSSAYFSAFLIMFSMSSLLRPPEDWITTEGGKGAGGFRGKEEEKRAEQDESRLVRYVDMAEILCQSYPISLFPVVNHYPRRHEQSDTSIREHVWCLSVVSQVLARVQPTYSVARDQCPYPWQTRGRCRWRRCQRSPQSGGRHGERGVGLPE